MAQTNFLQMRAAKTIALIVALAGAGAPPAGAAGSPDASQFSVTVGDPTGANGAPDQSPRDAWRVRVDEARRRYEAYAARAYERYLLFSGAKARRAADVSAGESGFAAVLNDPTLRPNDIYVSDRGVLVFRGGSGPPYAAADFTPMPQERVRALSLQVELPPQSTTPGRRAVNLSH